MRPTPLFATLAAALAFAGTAHAQTVTNLVAGQKQGNGNYLWSYEVVSGTKPSLSNWVLQMCCDAFSAIVPSSVTATDWSFFDSPITGVTGLKFDDSYNDGEVRTVSFELNQDFTPNTNATYWFKAGKTTGSGTTVAPSCTVVNPNSIPEPSTLALAALALPFIRRRRVSP